MSAQHPLIISFYTADWLYPEHAIRFAKECEDLQLDHHIECRASAGGYLQNTCQKPQFILESLALDRPVLWIDVDGSILKKPDFFLDFAGDFAARRMPASRKRTWHVGTMYWAPSEASIAFIERWIENTGGMSDESSLEVTWQELGHTLSSENLPPEYFEIPRFGGPGTKDCVVLHRLSNSLSKRQQRKSFVDYENNVG